MTSYSMLRSLALLGLLVATCPTRIAAAPSAEMPESRWHCRTTGWAMRMHWRQVSSAEGCDGEACRLTMAPMTEGVLMTEKGRRVGVVEVRGDGLKGWRFKDIEGRHWQLRGLSDRLDGTVSDRRKRQAVSCRLAPVGGQE
jgi:hypothetical protein